MQLDTLLSGGLLLSAGTGLLLAFWGRLKAIGWRVISLGVVRFTVTEEGWGGEALQRYLWVHGRRSPYGERKYTAWSMFVRPLDRTAAVAQEKIGSDTTVFWFGWRPILVSYRNQSKEGADRGLVVTFLRGMFDPDRLIVDAVDEFNDMRHKGEGNRFTVERPVGKGKRMMIRENDANSAPQAKPLDALYSRYIKWRAEDIGERTLSMPLSTLALTPETECLIDEARRWYKSEKWYKERAIPWRLGWLFYGCPGTGKTSLAKAVAITLDLPLFAPELSTFEDVDFVEWWGNMLSRTPCTVLLEDIDSHFNKRESLSPEGMTFGCLLNCISGAATTEGVLLIITTNNIEAIDPALGVPESGGSSRPGRIDRLVEFKALDESCRRQLAARILADCPEKIEAAVRDTKGQTGSQVQDHCAKIALAEYWK